MGLLEAKITKKYFLIALVAIFTTLACVYGFSVKIMNVSFREQIRYRDELMARSQAKRIDFILQMMVNDMRVASLHSQETGPDGSTLFSTEVQKMLVRQPLYLFIQSVAQDGRLISRIPEPRHLEVFSATEIIERLRWSKSYLVSNLLTLPDGKKTFAVAYPVLDDDGIFHGAVLACVNLEIFSELLSETRIGQDGVVALLDSEGTVVAHTSTSIIGKSFRAHPLGRYLQLNRAGVWEGKLQQDELLVAYRPTFLGRFGLIVGESLTQAWAPSNRVMLILFQGFLVILAVAAGITLLGTDRVVKPISNLIRQTNEYRDRKRHGFDPINTGDEIELLSRTMGQMAKALTERERRLFNILESIPYAVITVDQQGRVTTFNQSAEQLTGYGREEMVGKPIDELPLKADKGEMIALKTLREGKSFDELDSYILDKQNRRHEVKMHSALYRAEDKQIQGAIIVIRDVSEVKKLEEYLHRSEQLASLGQLTAGIAHEIKNPLSIIQAAAEGIQLELDELTDKDLVRSYAEDIFSTSVRMNGLIKEFLSLSMATREANMVRVNLTEIIKELLQLLKKKFQDQEIRLHCEYCTEDAGVLGRKNAFTQVFLNILLNSLQAMKDGGSLRVALKEKNGYWRVEIVDSGCGMSEDKLQRIFNPFFSTKTDGTGLGLSIAHEIITEHQGEIWAESAEGKGTSMYLELPQEQEGC